MNFGQSIDEFRRYLKRNNYSKNTVSRYCGTINKTLKNRDLEGLKQSDLDDIKLELSETYQINGNRLRYSAINLFCKRILKREDLNIKIPKSEAKNKDVLTSEEVEKILNWTVGHMNKAGLLPEQLNPFTGEHLSVAPLTWSHSTFVNTVLKYDEKMKELS